MIHDNSRLAYDAFGRVRPNRKAQVLSVYQTKKKPLTDRQVMQEVGFVDPNTVRPVITGLIHTRTLKEVGDTICPVTGHKCRLVALASYKERQEKLFK